MPRSLAIMRKLGCVDYALGRGILRMIANERGMLHETGVTVGAFSRRCIRSS